MPAECEAGFLLAEHPNLTKYLIGGNPCRPRAAGSWNSFTGPGGGWEPVAFDLSAYAGQQVEIIVSYVTDPFTGGTGVMIDDTRLVVGGTVVDSEGFEAGFGAWTVPGAPAGSPGNTGDWVISEGLGGDVTTAGVATEDSVTFGFGLEQLESDAARAAIVGAVLELFGT